MSDQSKAENNFRIALPFIPPNFVKAWQGPMKALLEEQAELLDESRKMTATWLKRREEAMAAGMQACSAIAACRDPGMMTAILSEWLTDSVNRVMADMNEARDEGVRLAEIGQKLLAALFAQSAHVAATEQRAKDTSRREPADATHQRTAAE